MTSDVSKYLNARQLRGLNKLGDAMLPGYQELKGFSALGCAHQVDRILDHMPANDRNDLKLLLTVMALLPMFFVRGFLNLLEGTSTWNGPVGALLRFVRLGVRGLVMTLYYSHPKVTELIGYQVNVYTADLRASGHSRGEITRSPQP